MRKIQVLGTGCPKCKLLMANTEAAVKDLGIEAQIEKVEKIVDITFKGSVPRIKNSLYCRRGWPRHGVREIWPFAGGIGRQRE